jgi:hypothetical protein
MSDMTFSEDVLRTINEKHISPKPKWEFLIRDWAVWTAGAISILIGGMAVALMITIVRTDDLIILRETKNAGIGLAMVLFPYFWIAVFIGFLFLARLNLKHTKRGYRLTLPVFAGISIALSIILGVCFYDAGISQMIDSALTGRPGRFLEFVHPRADLWTRPDEGMLGGVIIEIKDERTFLLNDFSNRSWLVHIRQAEIDANELPVHARIRCTGTQIGQNEFTANHISPWGSRKTILFPLPPPPNSEFFLAPTH